MAGKSTNAPAAAAAEQTPLLGLKDSSSPPAYTGARLDIAATSNGNASGDECQTTTFRESLYEFLEAHTTHGRIYEAFTVVLILLSIASFVFGTLFVPEYNDAPYVSQCGKVCDALWFGNRDDNGLGFLGLGTTSILEMFVVFVFTVDYLCRLWCADLESDKYKGFWGRIRFIPTFYSIVDLASTVPFYMDAFVLVNTDLASSQFLRMFRLFRMAKVEGRRYATALTMFDDVLYEQRSILGTALFVGMTTWIAASSFYYLAERKHLGLIYCGGVPDDVCNEDDIDTSLCTIDGWGIVDCTDGGCPPTDEYPEPCYHLYRSIPSASYFTLLNLFGEFPNIDAHSVMGKVVGTIVAVVAVAVFALPAGIVGNGFEDLLARRREEQTEEEEAAAAAAQQPKTTRLVAPSAQDIEDVLADDVQATAEHLIVVQGNEHTVRGRMYNFLFNPSTTLSIFFEHFVNALVLGTALTFIIGTIDAAHVKFPALISAFGYFETFSVVVFTIEYVTRMYAAAEDPRYDGLVGRWTYAKTFLSLVDLLSFIPFWIAQNNTFVRCLRLLRILRFERYTLAFTTFDDVLRANADVLVMTGFTAIIMWILFSAILYLTERDNPDEEMASFYNTVPNAMWTTLLNLSGESPLCHYSVWGKVTTGIIGVFATGLFGIPIGILGAGFQELAASSAKDTPDDDVHNDTRSHPSDANRASGSDAERSIYNFVNGIGSKAAMYFEIAIYALIILTVLIGIVQTVEGQEDTLHTVEWIAVLIFTLEYLLRLVAAPADPDVGVGLNPVLARFRYVFSFYSVVDLAAIVPMYLAAAMPGGWFDQHDEYLRMLRLIRLIKLDKYVPSITLIDDVLRLKKKSLLVTGYAACTLWVIFAALLFLVENDDYDYGIDDVPVYGCDSDCTMADRFRSMLDSLIYTGIHLTGDYPITTYAPWSRVTCFFMVIAAVGVVSVPSGLIADGFSEIVESRNKAKHKSGEEKHKDAAPGDDWYEFQLAQLRRSNTGPPPSRFGPMIDEWQIKVHEFLNGRAHPVTGIPSWTFWSMFGRIFMLTLIVTNVLAVLVESIPEIDRAVGNEPGNAFDVFEAISVMFFALEYALRMFSARKNQEALYSPWVYATTFYGIVDLLSTAPWFVEQALIASGHMKEDGDNAKIFRIFRVFRILQLEDFIVAFSKLDNVFRASKDVLKATGLMASIIWVGCGALFFIFEQGNPNWRSCDSSIPIRGDDDIPGCFDFSSTAECNEYYGAGMCEQTAFTNMPDSLYYTAVFLVGEWGLVDFTWPGRFVCMFLCVAGIALYAIPVGTLFDSFGAVLGMGGDDDDEEEEEEA